MKILLTGATGFLGRNLLAALQQQGHVVVALARASSNRERAGEAGKHACWQVCSEGSPDVFAVHPDVECVIHTATCYGRQGEDLATVLDSNLNQPLALLSHAIANGVKLFINTSSSLPRDLNYYALSKAQFSDWGAYFAGQEKIRFVDICLEHIYGPGDDTTKFMTYVIDTLLKNTPELKLTKGEAERDFIYIDDVVAAYLTILHSPHKQYYTKYSVGSGKTISIRKMVELIHTLSHSSTNLQFGAIPYRKNETMLSVANNTEIEKLGWKAQTDIIDGIKKTFKAMK